MAIVGLDTGDDDPTLDPLRINLTDEQYAACCADRSQNGPPAWDSPDNAEHIDYVGGQAAELASVQALPPVPTSVLTAAEQDCERPGHAMQSPHRWPHSRRCGLPATPMGRK